MSTFLTYPEKSARWYTNKGEPIYEIPCKSKDGHKEPTITDAKEKNFLPSVTTILQVLAKPGLEAWKQNQILLSALTHPNPNKLGAQELAKLIVDESREDGKRAADKGQRIHRTIGGLLTQSMEDCFSIDPDICDVVMGFMSFASQHSIKPLHMELPFASEDGFAGKMDFVGHFDSRPCVIDFKTQSAKGGLIKFYDEWEMQLGAYYYGWENEFLDNGIAVAIGIDVDTPGNIQFKSYGKPLVGFEMFMKAFDLWRFTKNWIEQ
jgi:hypothetical protein